jgi:hypothetical protein
MEELLELVVKNGIVLSLKEPLLAALLLLASPAYSNEDIQRRFSEAMLSIERDPKSAAAMLEALTGETDAIRIKLELARALYLSGQLRESRKRFVEVLDELPASAPPQVRANVERFLIDINRKLNPVRFGFSIVKDSNPTQSTETRKVTLFGLEFDYTPQREVKEEYGLRLTGDFLLKPSARSELAGFLAHTQYETSDHSRTLFVPELRYLLWPNKGLWARLGFEYEGLNKETLRQSPFIGIRKLDNFPAKSLSTMVDLRWVKQSFPDYPFVDGSTLEAQTFLRYQLKPDISLNGSITLERTSAKEDAYASRSHSVGYGVSFANLVLGIDVNLNQRHRARRYDGSDPFFGYRRDDRELTQSASFQKSGLYVWGILPSLEVIRERRDSNIKIVEFDRTQVVLSGTKLF